MKIIDMHCDTISRIYQKRQQGKPAALRNNSFQLDLEKMKHAGYLLQNFAMFIDLNETKTPYETCRQQISVFQEEMKKNQDVIIPITTYEEIIQNEQQGKMSALMTLEEGEVCGGSLEKLKEFYDLGIRMMTFTWNYPNSLGFPGEPADQVSVPGKSVSTDSCTFTKSTFCQNTGCSYSPHPGLTARGMEFLEEMERLGIIPDVSHLSDQGIADVCRLAKKPFCASHSNARALCSRGRNLPDELIRGIAERGGIIGANYYGPFLSDTPNAQNCYFSYVKDISLHIRHIADIGGISCIGLGSDFDGIDDNLEMKDCSRMELLEGELRKCGFHENEIEQIFYRNVLEFYKELL